MSFWDKALEVTKKTGERVMEEAQEIQRTKQKLDSMSNDELIKIAKNDGFWGNSPRERKIAVAILRSRGASSS